MHMSLSHVLRGEIRDKANIGISLKTPVSMGVVVYHLEFSFYAYDA